MDIQIEIKKLLGAGMLFGGNSPEEKLTWLISELKTLSRVELPVRVQIAEERENILLSDLVRHLRTDFEDGEIISYRIKVKQPFSTREIRYPGK